MVDVSIATYIIFYLLLLGPGYILFRLTVSILNISSSFIPISRTKISEIKNLDKTLISSFFAFIILSFHYLLFKQNILDTTLGNIILTTDVLQYYLLSYFLIFSLLIITILLPFILLFVLDKSLNNILNTILFFVSKEKAESILNFYNKANNETFIGAGVWNLLNDVRRCNKKKTLFTFFLNDSNIIRGFVRNYKLPPNLEIDLYDVKIEYGKKKIRTNEMWIPYENIKYYSMDRRYQEETIEYPYIFWIIATVFFGVLFSFLNIFFLLPTIISLYLVYKKEEKKPIIIRFGKNKI